MAESAARAVGTVGAFLQSARRQARFDRLRRLYDSKERDSRASLSEAWTTLAGRLRKMVRADCAVQLEAELAPFTCRLSGLERSESTAFGAGKS